MSEEIGRVVSTEGPPTRAASFQDVYANQIRLAVSPADFTLVFGVNDDRGPGFTTNVDLVAVRLSPSAMRNMVRACAKLSAAYDEVNGTPKVANEQEFLVRFNEVVNRNK
ncbi:hypothetical protein GXW71_28290 [Roseomonas hellenica]|uniref:DUF3467 domain-containing protein n=1 Tax=Plastoroseomonas hellenica TaxID=2687306 RepID=A0ABS5F6U8_9PROT|nr:hypothetical protein [Plastoroseomonas hellenica]MBR0668285.1 hypothetical protein [Plastoroseomonas hellenica]